MIRYAYSTEGVSPGDLAGFFAGWPNPPSPVTHRTLLDGSAEVVLVVDDDSGRVVGFITAVSDGVLSYIPFLEVVTEYRRRGIGSELVRQMLARLERFYMVDLLCDTELQAFDESLGMTRASGR